MMRTCGFHLACIRFCLLLVLLPVSSVIVQAQSDLPLRPALLQPANPTLFNLLDEVDGDRMMNHIEVFQNMRTRHIHSPKNMPDQGIGAAARYIFGQFEAVSLETGSLVVLTQPFSVTWGGQTSQLENIIAVIPGTDPTSGAIIIGAHYDSRCENLDDGLCYAPGANDNASGVAALIELSRVLSAHHTHHHATIMFVAFAAEEIGLVGSRVFVSDYIQRLDIPVSLMINLDIIGGSQAQGEMSNNGSIRLFSAGPDDSSSRHLARQIQLIAYHYVPDMGVLVQDRADRVGRYGDHIPFSDAGYAAVRFIEETEDTAHQHNMLDTIEQIQPAYLWSATRTVLAVVTVLADGMAAPQDSSLVLNEDGTCVLVWQAVAEASSYVVALRSANSPIYDRQYEVSTASILLSDDDMTGFANAAVAVKDGTGVMGPFSADWSLGSSGQACRNA